MIGDERGVSEVVGFVLTFALIISSVGIVATIGFDQLEDLQENEQLKSSQNGMINLAESFGNVHQRTDLSRRSGLALSGGTVQFNDSSFLNVSGGSSTWNISTSALAFNLGDGAVVYDGGGLYFEPGGIVSRPPALTCRADAAIISVLTFERDQLYLTRGSDRVPFPGREGAGSSGSIRIDNGDSVPSEGSITLRAKHLGTSVDRQRFSSKRDIRVRYNNTVSPDGWAQFASRSENQWEKRGDTIVCEDVSQILVRNTTASLEIGAS